MKRNRIYLFLKWYYLKRVKKILRAWRNLLKFNIQYFSIPLLIKTLFSYWRNYHEDYGRGFDIKRYFSAFTFNAISRVLGAFIRSVIILIGCFVEFLIFLGGLIFLVVWLFLPFLLIGGFFLAIKILT